IVDLASKVARVRVLHASLFLALRQLLAPRLEERLRGPRALVDHAELGPRGPGRRSVGVLARLRGGLFGLLHQITNARRFLLLGRRIAQRARFLVRELLDLAADLGAERAPAPLERLELARVARHFALEPRRARCEIPRLRDGALDLARRVALR